MTIYSGASVLGGETVIGKNSTIGGSAFITESVPEGSMVSVKRDELEYRVRSSSVKKQKKESVWLRGRALFYIAIIYFAFFSTGGKPRRQRAFYRLRIGIYSISSSGGISSSLDTYLPFFFRCLTHSVRRYSI